MAALAALVLVAASCGGGSESGGPRIPEFVEIRGSVPSTTLRTRSSSVAGTTTAPEGIDSLSLPPVSTSSTIGATPTVASGPPYRVETGQVTLIDTSRGTAPRGSGEAKRDRTLVTTMYAPVNRAKAPLIVFAIGFNNSAQGYDTFPREIAAAGYMVAVPEFPLATKTLPGPGSEQDIANQPADVSFVIGQLIAASKRSGPFLNAIDVNRIGVVGQSDGGNAVSALGLNACCIDNRIKAVVSLAGEKNFLPNTWTSVGSLPYLAIHGTADTVTPFAHGEELYKLAGTPKFLVPIAGADHLGPVTDNALRPKVVRLTVDFLNFYVNANASAYDTFLADAKEPPMSVQLG